MNALLFLVRKSLKNRLKELRCRPSLMLLAGIISAFILFGIILSFTSSNDPLEGYRPIKELESIFLALYIFVFVMSVYSGLNAGANFFTMPDVSFLFMSPLSPRKILFYGIIRKLGASLLLGLFLIYQYSWMNSVYGLRFPALLAYLAGYAVTLFSAQLTSVVIYSFTSASPFRRRMVRITVIALIAAVLVSIAIPALSAAGAARWQYRMFYTDPRLEAMISAACGVIPSLFPVAGWMKCAAAGLSSGWLAPLAGFLGTAAYNLACIAALVKGKPDYYEDVLTSAEVSFTAITAAKQGKTAEAVRSNVKAGKTGLGRGTGPSVFFFKHRTESRRNRMLILEPAQLIWVAVSLIYTFFMRSEGIVSILVFITIMQVMQVSTGRWIKELLFPYVYMMPHAPFKKLIMLCADSILQGGVEAAVMMVPAGIILGAGPFEILAYVLVRFSFSLLFISGTIASERLFGSVVSRTLVLALYFTVMVVIALPGIILAAFFGTSFGTIAGLAAMTVWNAGASALITYLCRDILLFAELNNK